MKMQRPTDKESSIFNSRIKNLIVSDDDFQILEKSLPKSIDRKIAEALFIKQYNPLLNDQKDSYRLKLFNWYLTSKPFYGLVLYNVRKLSEISSFKTLLVNARGDERKFANFNSFLFFRNKMINTTLLVFTFIIKILSRKNIFIRIQILLELRRQ